jgi:uncharacterized protein with GYD domain
LEGVVQLCNAGSRYVSQILEFVLLRTSLFVFLGLLMSIAVLTGVAKADDRPARHFMFIGEPNAAAWKFLMANPADRQKEVEAGMDAVGGKVLSYYFGLGNGKNYITVQLPDDNEVIQAVYLMRLPSGLLNSYQIIELMPSSQRSAALKRSQALIELEKNLGGGVE